MNFSNELIERSLSNSCGTSSGGNIKKTETLNDGTKIYPIPNRYFKDKLTLLPINPNHSFVYWEVTNDTLKKFDINPEDVQLSFKIYDEQSNEILNFDSHFSIGDYYITHTTSHKAMYAKLFLKNSDSLIFILKSNIIGVLEDSLKSGLKSKIIDSLLGDNEQYYNSKLLTISSSSLGGK
ncbi:DUF4912 domain-containing protein [Arcobacter sp. FWKO B]|uniref:DUF4912 domain-containing protein n=1 Tax=Arcobacter sp. FWKO B TaxID=2593672 RepID=UPI0018A5AE6B|nr:DUF4912 domain-containing protein [Arcobacter sp. FWKO B]QOG11466.1 DUF4912 domain-containing protein [Arcobacter sp. FWKO B]